MNLRLIAILLTALMFAPISGANPTGVNVITDAVSDAPGPVDVTGVWVHSDNTKVYIDIQVRDLSNGADNPANEGYTQYDYKVDLLGSVSGQLEVEGQVHYADTPGVNVDAGFCACTGTTAKGSAGTNGGFSMNPSLNRVTLTLARTAITHLDQAQVLSHWVVTTGLSTKPVVMDPQFEAVLGDTFTQADRAPDTGTSGSFSMSAS